MTKPKFRPAPETLTDALYELVHQSRIPAKAQADTLGLSYSTLNNASNGNIESARFQASWLVPLTNLTGNYVALDIMERLTGRIAIKVDVELIDETSFYEEALSVTKKLGDTCGSILDATTHKNKIKPFTAFSEEDKLRIRAKSYALLQEAGRLWKMAEGL